MNKFIVVISLFSVILLSGCSRSINYPKTTIPSYCSIVNDSLAWPADPFVFTNQMIKDWTKYNCTINNINTTQIDITPFKDSALAKYYWDKNAEWVENNLIKNVEDIDHKYTVEKYDKKNCSEGSIFILQSHTIYSHTAKVAYYQDLILNDYTFYYNNIFAVKNNELITIHMLYIGKSDGNGIYNNNLIKDLNLPCLQP